MTRHLFILFLILSSCSGKQTTINSSNSEIKKSQVNPIQVEDDTSSEAKMDNDTIFIKREITDEYYHVIYIDTTRNSKYYDWLTEFEFNNYDLGAYKGNYQYLKEKYPETFNNVNALDIPENWIPVYSYKNRYYLYAPSDWGNAGKRIINDSAFVYWYMDGPLPVPLKSAQKVENGTIIIEMIELFNDSPTEKTLTIHQIDPKTRLSVFEFTNEPENYKYQLYIPIESAKQFDMIVNYCKNQKQMELDFDPIDFEKLITEADKMR